MSARFVKIAVVGVVALTGGLVYTACMAETGRKEAKARIGKSAPDFGLKDTFGKSFTLSEFKGKTVVLEWINQDCPISAGKHKDKTMQNVYKKYAPKGVVWLAIDTTHYQKPEKNRIYAAQMNLAYPILHDPDGKVGRAYGATKTPHMYVIDKTGKLVYVGAIDDQGETNYVAAALESILAGKAVAKAKTDSYGCSVKYQVPKKKMRTGS
jgi:peroxiredoxin